MGSFDMGGIGSPAGGFERRSIKEAVVYGNKSLTDAVGNFAKITCPQLVGHQAGRVEMSVSRMS
jgi:hypothetical protein